MWPAMMVTLIAVLPLVAPRPAAHDKGHAVDGLGLGLGRPALALPFIGQDDDDLPLVGKRDDKRSAPSLAHQDLSGQDYMDYSNGVRYDEYPMIVPRATKRTAAMVDRLFGMLKNAVNGDATAELRAIAPDDRMDLQRRGQQKGRVYWRCYFNAVTCYRRK